MFRDNPIVMRADEIMLREAINKKCVNEENVLKGGRGQFENLIS